MEELTDIEKYMFVAGIDIHLQRNGVTKRTRPMITKLVGVDKYDCPICILNNDVGCSSCFMSISFGNGKCPEYAHAPDENKWLLTERREAVKLIDSLLDEEADEKMISGKNYKSSVKKWKRIVKEIETSLAEHPDEKWCIEITGKCGFCKEYLNHLKEDSCEKCPLFKERLCNQSVTEETVFWKLDHLLSFPTRTDLETALPLAQQMLKRIEAEPNSVKTENSEQAKIRKRVWYSRYLGMAETLKIYGLDKFEAIDTLKQIHSVLNSAHCYSYRNIANTVEESLLLAVDDIYTEE